MIIGASGHGKVVADIAKKSGYGKIIFLDDDESLNECDGYPVVGKGNRFLEYDCDIFVAIGNTSVRQSVLEHLREAGKSVPVLVHPDAVIADRVIVGAGTVVMAGAVINPGTIIGRGCIINTCASVDHDCRVNDYVHISVGAHVAGTVSIGEFTWIGTGVTVSNNISICPNCMIGAGAVVVKNIEEEGTYVGVPARKMCMDKNGNLGG